MNGGRDGKKQPPKMMRSSVACVRCRRSKVKCVNDGSGGVCKACENTNRECTYPTSGPIATPKRDPGIKLEEGESKKRTRKVEDAGRRGSTRTEDALESSILTKKVWDEVYEMFKSHFSTEMSFLHPPSFRARFRQAAYPRDSSTSAMALQGSRLLLLGVLTLTARFHSELVNYHAQPGKTVEPLNASEYYATALKAECGNLGLSPTSSALNSVQALLMLGLYEWQQTRGLTAWLYVGLAIRLAQSMALSLEDAPEDQMLKPVRVQKRGAGPLLPPREDTIGREVKRRTLWSCFVMDRMLSAGKARPNMISATSLRVQLPCSDESFMFARPVQAGFLKTEWLEEWLEDDYERKKLVPPVNDDGVMNRYIRLVEIFGRFSEWSYAGGRRREKLPPWNESTRFYKLSKELENFHDALPSNLTFTEANLSAHIESKNATAYVSMHTLYSLCLIMLNREYVPFLPFRCVEGPEGPLDAPTFPKKKYPAPKNFWHDSAGKMCHAARNIVDIVRTCQENTALPESPQVQFAVYQAAFVCVYILYFPKMDPHGDLHSVNDGHINSEPRFINYDAITVKILREMVPRSKMVKFYLKTLTMMHEYFRKSWSDFGSRFGKQKWTGGGLDEYTTMEKELKEFGSLEDADKSVPSDGSDNADQGRSRASTNDLGSALIPAEHAAAGDPMEGIQNAPTPRAYATPATPWAAVNASSPQVDADDRQKFHPGQAPPYTGPFQSPNLISNPPSLVSPSNGESTPGIHSPHAQNPQYPYQHNPAYQQMSYLPQHVIPVTHPQPMYTDEANERWMQEKEQIHFSASNFDGFAQMDPWQQDPVTYEYQQNFFDIVSGLHPAAAEAEQT